jgi:hypothetical protein
MDASSVEWRSSMYPFWQKDAAGGGVHPINSAQGLDELRRFRHVAMYVYEDFEPQRAQRAVNAARGVLPRLKPSLETFKAVIDPD